MGAAAIVMGVAALIGAGAQVQQSREQSKWQQYQADQAEADALAERDAAKVRAEQIRAMGEKQRSTAVASMAASGIETTGQGSALTIQDQIMKDSEYDALQEEKGGDYRYKSGMAESKGLLIQAGQTKRAGYIGAATTLAGAYGNSQR